MLWQIALVAGMALALFPPLRRWLGRLGWWLLAAFILAILVVTAQQSWG